MWDSGRLSRTLLDGRHESQQSEGAPFGYVRLSHGREEAHNRAALTA